MDDMMMTIPAEEQPMTAVISDGDTVIEDANPAESVAIAQECDEACEETTEQVSQSTLMPTSEEAVYMPVYNGEVRPIRANEREEITTLLQLGMKQREFLPSYERLSRLAKENGMPSVKALIDRMCDRHETHLRERAIGQYGEENGQRFYEMDRAQRERRYEALMSEEAARGQQQREDDARRLAEQFVQLQQEYPQYADVCQVPQQVLESALQNGISLLDAQNRFVLAEQRRQERQKRDSAAAADGSTGSLGGNAQASKPSVMEAFLAGLHSRL